MKITALILIGLFSFNVGATTLKCEFSGEYMYSPSSTLRWNGESSFMKESIRDLGNDVIYKVELDIEKQKVIYKGNSIDFIKINDSNIFFAPPQTKPIAGAKLQIAQPPISISINKRGSAVFTQHYKGTLMFAGGYCL